MIVLIPQDLVLEDVVYGIDGALLSGWVVNGGWRFVVTATEFECKDGFGRLVCSRPRADFRIVELPTGFKGDYNAAIALAHCPQVRP